MRQQELPLHIMCHISWVLKSGDSVMDLEEFGGSKREMKERWGKRSEEKRNKKGSGQRKKLDWERSLIKKKKGLEEPNSMWNIYLNERSYELESKKCARIVRWRHSLRHIKWSGGAKKLEGKLSRWSEEVKVKWRKGGEQSKQIFSREFG